MAMLTGESWRIMATHTFQLLSDEEIIDLKRSRGVMACAECQKRKLKCDKKFPCTSCVRRGQADICPTGDLGPIGRGKRAIRAEHLELNTVILTMGDRIRQLESAVAEAHGEESESPHPLLREDLLAIKRPTKLPRSSPDPTPAQLADMFGSLAVSASGASRYFGPTAGPAALLSAQGSAGGDRAEFASSFADITESFPFDPLYSMSWDPIVCRATLLAHLPDELRAWTLFDIYVNKTAWYGTPLMADELHDLLAEVYEPNQHLNPNAHELSSHALAVVFLAFGLAALADLSLPAYNVQGDAYFDLGRTALTLEPVFGSRDLRTVQALVLAAMYHVTGGPRYSTESAWSLGSMACSLCQTLRLHREGAHTCFDNKTAQRRRATFWEVYSFDTLQAVSFARPPTIALTDITCEFPADPEQTMDGEGRTIPGFYHSKWKFMKDIIGPMAQVYSRATSPTYEEVLDLDRRLRQFIESAPFAHYGKDPTLLAHFRSSFIPRICNGAMVYMHRSSFVQALKDRPHNPLESPYAASFLAAYRAASNIIKGDTHSFALFPQEYHRWWPIWKAVVTAAFIVGSIVAKCPTSKIAPKAFGELQAAVALVEQGARHSFLAEGSLLVLQRLRNKATAAYAEVHPLVICPNPNPDPAELADEEDFESLGGSRAFLRAPVQNQNHHHNQNHPHNLNNSTPLPNTLSIPTLISGLIPAASAPDAWQPDISDSAFTGFAFEALMTGGSQGPPPTTPLSFAQSMSLEAYLSSVEMQVANTNSSYAEVVPQVDWALFVNSLQ
ncbi:fungal-specific transcription factor domain-containing protein [Mycena epipterygia]|nr:fungal-specific transcription factor domain-containing protein [Mycena epipterygia]